MSYNSRTSAFESGLYYEMETCKTEYNRMQNKIKGTKYEHYSHNSLCKVMAENKLFHCNFVYIVYFLLVRGGRFGQER